ncbi:acyl-CoA dehydrogenase family protein [Mycobacterium sp. E1747]|uniref:acyl-CoA dehydrogenase family protein n=1 Tax=Mycobacterium sp. E1747 TaxID=1834128 RepID=UPI0007FEBF7C|nr:acyl-CoA dehydrogenase family protein [Mycobacterium sp. E1747]OBH05899.1 acyl-CoA dehydrogenase [Mycobacterium sp. E1747]
MTEAEQAKVLDTARELAKEFAEFGPVGDAENRFPLELVPRYKESGLAALAVPKKYGGLGGDIWTTTQVSRELAKGDPAIALAFNMHQTMVGVLRGLLDEEARKSLFGRVAGENALVCGCFSEDRAGLMGLADTLAVPADDGWLISGTKTWATMCQGADIVTFNATITDADGKLPEDVGERATREGVFVLPMDGDGVKIKETWDTLGMRATGTQTVIFDNAPAPVESYGGTFRLKFFAEFEWAAMSFAGVYCGMAEKIYAVTRDIIKTKNLGATLEGANTALKDIGHVPHDLGRMCFETEVAVRTLEATARILLDGRDEEWGPFARAPFIDVTKVASTETAIRVADAALRLVGGSAFRRGHVLERLYRDARSGPFHPLTTDQLYTQLGQFELIQ